MKKRILFVDDERNVLDGLRRMLRGMRHEWEMVFAEGGPAALEILAREPFDMVVSDMRMPGMDGWQLLTKVQELYPRLVRIILSGYSDQEMILNSVRVAHQYLSKPCDPETVRSTLRRALALREFLSEEALIRVVSRIETLPSAPSIYNEVIQELSRSDTSIQKIGEIIARDVSMTAKILHLANSAFFGLHQSVNTLERALVLLGFDTVVALVLSVHVFATCDTASPACFSIQALWDHSFRTALFARTIARKEEQGRKGIDDAFMGGLLHDVGGLVLAANLPDTYSQVVNLARSEGCSVREAEEEVLGTTHAEVGAYLMGLWGLPDQIVEAIVLHHSPGRSLATEFTPLTAVHAADSLAQPDCAGSRMEPAELIDGDYLARLNLAARFPLWEDACRKLIHEGAVND